MPNAKLGRSVVFFFYKFQSFSQNCVVFNIKRFSSETGLRKAMVSRLIKDMKMGLLVPNPVEVVRVNAYLFYSTKKRISFYFTYICVLQGYFVDSSD